ncbi:hypothetical protein SRHO_G00254520 [Serrasalmus rhombeus]
MRVERRGRKRSARTLSTCSLAVSCVAGDGKFDSVQRTDSFERRGGVFKKHFSGTTLRTYGSAWKKPSEVFTLFLIGSCRLGSNHDKCYVPHPLEMGPKESGDPHSNCGKAIGALGHTGKRTFFGGIASWLQIELRHGWVASD